ncbi:MAG: hypothetical protein MUF16_03975 [Burkholderiaceae bacterium]|jgi:hypothetical protein|nr:hypothetical protein [Burkholderiaceae bacterium]
MQLDGIGIAAVALLAAAASSNTCAQAPAAPQARLGPVGSTVYVFASRATLRAQPQVTATVLAQPVANTGLKLVAETGEWCEVETAARTEPPPLRGFIACSLLRASPLTLAGVRAELDAARRAGKGVLDWESRGFWVAPSLLRWSRVGQALEATHLTREIASREISGGKALRFKVPEFEAMKQRLAAGVLVAAEALEPVPAEPLPSPVAATAAIPSAGLVDPTLARVRIPPIEPSLFQADQVPVLDTAIRYKETTSHRALLLADALSARSDAPFQAVVTQPAAYALGPGAALLARSNQPRFIRTAGPLDVIIGVWDVGALQVTFAKDAFLHGVTAQGLPTRERVLGLELDFAVDHGCGGTARVELRSAAVPGFTKASSALVKWVGMAMPGGATARAQVKSRKFGGAKPADMVVTHEIDLNSDTIADFFVMQGRYVPQISGDGLWTAVYGNVNGQWFLLSYDQEEDCT